MRLDECVHCRLNIGKYWFMFWTNKLKRFPGIIVKPRITIIDTIEWILTLKLRTNCPKGSAIEIFPNCIPPNARTIFTDLWHKNVDEISKQESLFAPIDRTHNSQYTMNWVVAICPLNWYGQADRAQHNEKNQHYTPFNAERRTIVKLRCVFFFCCIYSSCIFGIFGEIGFPNKALGEWHVDWWRPRRLQSCMVMALWLFWTRRRRCYCFRNPFQLRVCMRFIHNRKHIGRQKGCTIAYALLMGCHISLWGGIFGFVDL